MIEINKEKAFLGDKAKELTANLVNAIYDTGNVKGFYESLDGHIQALISKANFQKLLTRLHTGSGKKNLSRIKDPENGVTIRISQSQIFTYEIIKKLGINPDDFFSLNEDGSFDGLNQEDETKKMEKAIKLAIAQLNDKMDFITDCVNTNKRGACNARFYDLNQYLLILRNQMNSICDTISDFNCPNEFMLLVNEEVKKLGFRSNKLLEAVIEIIDEKIKLERHCVLLIYSVLALLVFIKKLLLFVASYKASHRKDLNPSLIIEDDISNYLNFRANKDREELFIDMHIKPLYKEALQIIDSDRLKKEQPNQEFVKKFVNALMNLTEKSSEIFFNPELIKFEKIKEYFEDLYNLSAWGKNTPHPEYTRLFITKDFVLSLENMRCAVEDYDDEEED